MMQNAEKLKENLCEIDSNLNDNAITAISNAIHNLEKYRTVEKNITKN